MVFVCDYYQDCIVARHTTEHLGNAERINTGSHGIGHTGQCFDDKQIFCHINPENRFRQSAVKAGNGVLLAGGADILMYPVRTASLHQFQFPYIAGNCRLRRVKASVTQMRYQFFLPCMGAFFAPHYGQSYYEMFSLGHRDGIVSFSSFHNKPSHWHNLTLDVPLLKKTTLRLGYLIDIRQTSQHELKYHNWSHNFTLGLVHKFIKL